MLLFYENEPRFEYEIRGLLIGFWPGAFTKKSEHARPEAEDLRVPAGKENRPEEHFFFRFTYEGEEGVLAGGLLASFEEGASGLVTEHFALTGPRPAQKTALKQALYAVCSALTGQTLPWGALTGIRPTKIPSARLAAGLSEEETAARIMDRLGGASTVFVGTSGTETESRIAFAHGALGCNGIYDSFSLGPKITFDTMPFGFKNHVILSSINFTQKHMEEAIGILADSHFDELVELIDRDVFTADPMDAYLNKIYCKGAPLKTAVVWNSDYISEEE